MLNIVPEQIHVAVGIIRNEFGEVLIAFRDQSKHQGGLWEFPGGKVEEDESVNAALSRELYEELNLQVLSSTPLILVEHDYGDKQVLLDVWQVDEFQGNLRGVEGQKINWVGLQELHNFEFPKGNLKIVSYLTKS